MQPVVLKLLASAGPAAGNILHGTILGHPLHPAITDVPTGAWTVTAVLDAIELAGGPAIPGADAALVIGLGGAVGSIVTGYADWSDTHKDPRNLGMAHALLNAAGTALYVAALALRMTGRRKPGLTVSLAGYGFIAAGAYLGGEMSYGQLIGPRHTAEPLAPADAFTPVLPAAELRPDRPVRADFGGIPILLTRTAEGVAAISAVCTHRGAPLDKGSFADGCVTCPWHGSIFRLDDGTVTQGPASFPQPRFDARITADHVEVRALPV